MVEDVAAAPALGDLWPPVKPLRGIVGFLRLHPTIAIGAALLILMLLMAVLAPYLWTVDPTTLNTSRRTREPSALYWFGTDMLGRDIYSRVMYGARVSLTVGFAVAICASLAGLAIGLISGMVRFADCIIMRVMDGLMSIPPILLGLRTSGNSFATTIVCRLTAGLRLMTLNSGSSGQARYKPDRSAG